MSETPPNAGPQGPNGQAPVLRVLAQYMKDLSFENPKAPGVFRSLGNAPNINVNVQVGAQSIGEGQYEVELTVAAQATHENEPVFVAEITYAGAFEIANIPEDQIEPVLMIECPRLIFPFLRRILADMTQAGNFPPVTLDPIDFVAMYERGRMERRETPITQPSA